MKLLIPTKRAILNAIDIKVFSRLLCCGKIIETNAYPGTKRQKGRIKNGGVEIPKIRKTNIIPEISSRRNVHNLLYILLNETINFPILCILVPYLKISKHSE